MISPDMKAQFILEYVCKNQQSQYKYQIFSSNPNFHQQIIKSFSQPRLCQKACIWLSVIVKQLTYKRQFHQHHTFLLHMGVM